MLGAGIQGVCAALALAQLGHRVAVIEVADDCWMRTSLRGEGKIHLGLVYANDVTGRTAGLMLEAALAFGELTERFVGRAVDWTSLRSRPFTYAVLEDSMVPPAELFVRYAEMQARLETMGDACYLGVPITRLWEHNDAVLDDFAAPGTVAASVRTSEVAIDPVQLRALLREALHTHPGVTVWYGHEVREVERVPGGIRVRGVRTDSEAWSLNAGAGVNCLWHGRIALDAHLGITPPRPWVYRLKYRVLGRLPECLASLPSITFVLGRFGDIVVHPGRPTYLSWYPACLAGWSSAPTPPAEWARAVAGNDDRADALALARAAVDGIAHILPAFAGFEIETVDAGVIVAWGETDIDDPESELHERHAIGIHDHDGWYSIDTGKLTTAPLWADRLAALVGAPS